MILECSTSRNTELSHQNLDFSRNYLNELFRSTSRADTSPERAATVAQSFQNYRKAQIQCWSDLWGLVDSWIYPATHQNLTWIQRKIIKFYRKIVNFRKKASHSVAWASGVIQTCSDKVGIPSGSNQQCFSSFLIENGLVYSQIAVSELIFSKQRSTKIEPWSWDLVSPGIVRTYMIPTYDEATIRNDFNFTSKSQPLVRLFSPMFDHEIWSGNADRG